MPSWCSVSSCGNRSDKTSNVSYHKFPKNEDEKNLWILFCEKRSKWVPSATAKICSSHFKTHDFESNLRTELIGGVSRRILKRGAVPSTTNESGEEPSEITQNEENQGFIESVLRDIDTKEKERNDMVTKILEEAREEERVPSTAGNQGSVMVTQSLEESNLDYKALCSIVLEENIELRKKNSKLSNKIRKTQQKLKVLEDRSYFYRNKLLEGRMREKKLRDIMGRVLSNNQIDLLLKKKKRAIWRPGYNGQSFE